MSSFERSLYEASRCSSRRCLKRCGWLCALSVGVVVFFNCVLVPLAFYSSGSLRRRVIFWNSLDLYPMKYNDKPEQYGMQCTTNLYLKVGDHDFIGLWQMANRARSCQMFSDKGQVMMILHGNAASRRSPFRIEIYDRLREVGFDVVAFDYRGFGDSSGYPTAEHTVEDTFAVYRHIRRFVAANRIVVYGHSLGTGVATKFLARLNETVAGVVLESPFDRIGNVLLYHPAAGSLRLLPYFSALFVDGINNDPDTSFNSIDYVGDIDATIPVCIFATEDDAVVPAVLAKNLYDRFVHVRPKTPVTVILKTFEAKFRYGHQPLHRSDAALQLLAKFIGEKQQRVEQQ